LLADVGRIDFAGGKFAVKVTTRDISVVIPFYNREQFIDDAVQSVLTQTLQPLEIIIVNDCSKESSRRYLDRYEGVCKIVDLTKNVGLAGSRNAGIRVARGQFIALLDDDDIWLPNKLETQRQYMEEHPECSAVHSAVVAFFANRPDEVWARFTPGPMTLAQALSDEHWTVPSTLMVRTIPMLAIGGFDESFRECEDRDFMIRFAAAGYRIEGIFDPLIRLRRVGDDRLSEHRWRMYMVHVRIVWLHKALFYRVYGLRGLTNFLLIMLQWASRKTRYVDGAVRFLFRFIEIKWQVRPGYYEPVSSQISEQTECSVALAE
jgi:glycosyltransferase involved in cell wall biosynthesis